MHVQRRAPTEHDGTHDDVRRSPWRVSWLRGGVRLGLAAASGSSPDAPGSRRYYLREAGQTLPLPPVPEGEESKPTPAQMDELMKSGLEYAVLTGNSLIMLKRMVAEMCVARPLKPPPRGALASRAIRRADPARNEGGAASQPRAWGGLQLPAHD